MVRKISAFVIMILFFQQSGYPGNNFGIPSDKEPVILDCNTEKLSGPSNVNEFIHILSEQEFSLLRRRRSMIRHQALGVGANLLGPTLGYASAYLQYSFGRVVQAEAGLDISTVYTGLNLYPHVFNRIEELSPYMGLMVGYSDPLKQNIVKGVYAYMPVGVRFITPDDWYVCAELAATTASKVGTAPLFFGIKLGYLFKR